MPVSVTTENPRDDGILQHLASCPFSTTYQMEKSLDASTGAVHRALTRLREAGLVEGVSLGDTKALGYCLTGDGVCRAAAFHNIAPDDFCQFHALDRRHLLTRLPLLHRLVPGYDVVVDLATYLPQMDAKLAYYRSGPLHWRGVGKAVRARVLLDGIGRIIVTKDAGVMSYWFGFLWDGDATVSGSVVRHRLAQLRALLDDGVRALPPVLVVTTDVTRLGPSPRGVIYITTADYRAHHGPLSACWTTRLPILPMRGDSRDTDTGDLLALLERMRCAHVSAVAPTVWVPSLAVPGSVLGFEARVTRLRRELCEDPPTAPSLLALTLPSSVRHLLETVGMNPLLTAGDLHTLTGRNASVVRDELRWLRSLDLVRVYYRGRDEAGTLLFWSEEGMGIGPTPPVPAIGPAHRMTTYVMTQRGTRLLAARVGLPLEDFRRISLLLDASPKGSRPGLDFALGNAAHTYAIQDVFFAVHAAAVRRRMTLVWRWEWDAVRVLRDRQGEGGNVRGMRTVGKLRPDAWLTASRRGRTVEAFLEVDRSTATHAKIKANLLLYHRYARLLYRRASATGTGRDHLWQPVTVAFVTTESEQRAINLLERAKVVSRGRGIPTGAMRGESLKSEVPPLRVVAAYLSTITGQDPFDAVWFSAADPAVHQPVVLRRVSLLQDLRPPSL